MTRRQLTQRGGLALLALTLTVLAGCGWDGNICICGYTTAPMYDLGIRTVRVPIFKNYTYRKGLEFQVTEAIIREINAKTPYRVVQDCQEADTELIGTIVNRTKAVVNFNPLGEVRDAETTLSVELVWRDLRGGHTGEVLSQPPPGKPGDLPPPPGAPVPNRPQPPVLAQSMASFVPELGESLASAEKKMVDRLAVQVVSMMEKPW
jgi:hypothetical protein